MRHAREPDTRPGTEPGHHVGERERQTTGAAQTPRSAQPAISDAAPAAARPRGRRAAAYTPPPSAAYAQRPAVPYAQHPIPGQPHFSPASPPHGYNRRSAAGPTSFQAAPAAPATQTVPAVQPIAAAPAVTATSPAPARSNDQRPSNDQLKRPRGEARAKARPKRKVFRRPRIRIRHPRLIVTVAVIAALISANVGLMMMRSHREQQPANVPLTAAVASSPKASPSAAVANKNTSTRLGVFKATKSDVASFESWLGSKVQDVVHFSNRDTWQQISQPQLTEWQGTDYRLIYAVPLLPRSAEATKETSMQAGARGEYDTYFATLGRNLVAAGQEDAVLRVGWEFNLKTWPWGIDDHEVFKRYFQHVVTAMRAVPGAKFKVDWNVANAAAPQDGVNYYPGDKYVDYVGVDAYDLDGSVYPYPKACNDSCRLALQTRAWEEAVFGGERGLDFWSFFAAKHDKPLSFPEYGLREMPDGSGGGDNPYFIKQMHDFITWAPNNVAYAAYFDVASTAGEDGLRETFPDAAKNYLSWFGAPK